MAQIILNDIADISPGLGLSGHSAGVRGGDWTLRLVESANVPDDGWLTLAGLRLIEADYGAWTERHLLRPYDVLITARTEGYRVALVPPEVTRTVASATLFVIRPRDPQEGIGHWVWYYLASAPGSTTNHPAEAGQFIH